MTREELVDLQRRGFTIGGHGFDHLPFSTMTPAAQHVDMRRARDVMDDLLGPRPRPIAWPFGRTTEDTPLIAQALGYTRCFNTEGRVDARDVMDVLGREPEIVTTVAPLRGTVRHEQHDSHAA